MVGKFLLKSNVLNFQCHSSVVNASAPKILKYKTIFIKFQTSCHLQVNECDDFKNIYLEGCEPPTTIRTVSALTDNIKQNESARKAKHCFALCLSTCNAARQAVVSTTKNYISTQTSA